MNSFLVSKTQKCKLKCINSVTSQIPPDAVTKIKTDEGGALVSVKAPKYLEYIKCGVLVSLFQDKFLLWSLQKLFLI